MDDISEISVAVALLDPAQSTCAAMDAMPSTDGGGTSPHVMGFGLHKLRAALGHPLARDRKLATVKRFLLWKLHRALTANAIRYPFVAGTCLLLDREVAGDELNVLVGLGEFPEMGFLLHALRPGDLFIDVGSNLGSYAVLASGVIGARTIAVEPMPRTFSRLQDNIAINRLERLVRLLNVGLGEESGSMQFASSSDVLSHVVTSGDVRSEVVDVLMDRLDHVARETHPFLIKIDVEGFELNVLRGASATLRDPALRAIVVEMNGLGSRYGNLDRDIDRLLISAGFLPHSYEPFTRLLSRQPTFTSPNTIYVREVEYVQQRLQTAKAIAVGGREV